MQCFLQRSRVMKGVFGLSYNYLCELSSSVSGGLDDQWISGMICCVLKCVSVRLFETKANIWFSVKKEGSSKALSFMRSWSRINTQRPNTVLVAFFVWQNVGQFLGPLFVQQQSPLRSIKLQFSHLKLMILYYSFWRCQIHLMSN